MNTKRMYKKLVKNAQAVSPIIATLMLVLVSVGAAGAFYLWQTGWQGGITDKVGDTDIQNTFSIGGSSTVYEYSAVAKEIFEARNPSFKIELQKGGSGSGITAAGLGLVDIGSASKDASSSFVDYPDLNRDGEKDLGLEMVQTTVGYDGVVIVVSGLRTDIQTINRSAVEGMYEGTITDWSAVTVYHNNTGGPCGAGIIKTYDRSDESGTEECFCEKLMNKQIAGSSKQMAAGVADVGFGSNQELVAALAADINGIGFTAYGISQNAPGIRVIPFSTDGGNLSTGDGMPSPTEIKSGDWPGSRPLNYITVGQPTGVAKVFIDFVLMTEMNQLICEKSDYVSIYA